MHLDWRTRHKLRKIVHAILIFSVFVSLFAPQSTAMSQDRKQQEITQKVDEVLEDSLTYDADDSRAQLLIRILKLIPENLWKPLKSVKVEEKVRTPRGLKDRDSIAMNYQQIDSDEEFVAVFIHELGHVVDLDVWTGSSRRNSRFSFLDGSPVPADDKSLEFYEISWFDSNTHASGVIALDAVSEYGFTNPFEDFAESFIFYLLHGGSFKLMTKQNEKLAKKYEFIRKEAFDGQEFSFGDFFYDNEEIYDTTILFYDLDAFIAMMEEEKAKKQTVSRTSSSRPPRYSRS